MKFLNRNLHKARNFFRQFVRSCYDMEWYRVVRLRPWTKALRYLTVFCALLSLAVGASTLPAMISAADEVRKFAGSQIPADASFSMKDGHFSTTLRQPYEFSQGGFTLIVDTSIEDTKFPMDKIPKDGFMIGRDAVLAKQAEDQWRVYGFKDAPNMTVTGAEAVAKIDRYAMPAAIGFSALLTPFLFLGLYLGSLVYALWGALMALLASRLMKIGLSFRQWLAVALTAVTLPTLIDFGLQSFNIDIPFAFSFVFFAFIFSVLADERSRPTIQAAPPTPAP